MPQEGLVVPLENLPPRDMRTYPDEKIPTPTDERGLVDVPRLIAAVQKTVDPEYEWPRQLSIHHFYWPEADYPYVTAGLAVDNPAVFRNLPIHRGLLPRAFENWLHIITLPPPKPSEEVMHHRVEAWNVARSLFQKVRATIQTEKLARARAEYVRQNPVILKEEFDGVDIIGEEVMQEILERHFRGTRHHLRRLQDIPPEYRFIDPDDSLADMGRKLGRVVVPKAQTWYAPLPSSF